LMGPSVVEKGNMLYASTLASRSGSRVQAPVHDDRSQWHLLEEHNRFTVGRNSQTAWQQSLAGVGSAGAPERVICFAQAGCKQVLPQYVTGPNVKITQQPLSPAGISVFDCSANPRIAKVSMRSTSKKCLRFFEDLPIELWQFTMDLLPKFGERARLCMVCKTAAHMLEWRLAPPLKPSEEMSGLNLRDLGARAVTWTLKSQHSSIGELSLSNNNIGNKGALAISALIRDGCTIRRLSLRDNDIGDAGAHALATAMAANTSLEEIDLWGNNISKAGKAALVAATKCKVFLELERPPPQPSAWARLADGRMRTVLFEWISQIQTCAHGSWDSNTDPQDLLFRTFSYIDAYFACKRVRRTEMKLVGVASTLMAANQAISAASHEQNDELATWLAVVNDGEYTVDIVKAAAHQITEVLGFKMHTPTAYTFLRRYLRKPDGHRRASASLTTSWSLL